MVFLIRNGDIEEVFLGVPEGQIITQKGGFQHGVFDKKR